VWNYDMFHWIKVHKIYFLVIGYMVFKKNWIPLIVDEEKKQMM
jgi:hypothetical protein